MQHYLDNLQSVPLKNVVKKKKACPVGRYIGSLCTQKQPDWVVCSAIDVASWIFCVQLESQREQEAEKAAKKHDEVAKAHSRLKRLDKDLKQLITNQVCYRPLYCHLLN